MSLELKTDSNNLFNSIKDWYAYWNIYIYIYIEPRNSNESYLLSGRSQEKVVEGKSKME